jgi:hypothetical protein
MANGHYEPPKQSTFGQIFDSLFLLTLVGLSLFAPLWLGLAGGGKTELAFNDKTWTGMGQTPVMQQSWEKLGHTPETAQPIISSRFDYVFDPIMLAITIAVIVFYYFFVIRYSDKEYRDVIRERFGDK